MVDSSGKRTLDTVFKRDELESLIMKVSKMISGKMNKLTTRYKQLFKKEYEFDK